MRRTLCVLLALTFAGSTGIGNPHLHLEVRLDNDRVINPALAGVAVADTMAPQIFGIAVWQGNHLAITTPEAIDKGCVETPVKNEFNLSMAETEPEPQLQDRQGQQPESLVQHGHLSPEHQLAEHRRAENQRI